jgi:hypothetical protein
MPCLQDTVLTLTVPQYPFVLKGPSNVSFEEYRDHNWVACPQLFFTCHLRPKDGRLPKARFTYGKDCIQVALIFYSTFRVELLRLELPCSGPTEKAGCS